MKLWLVQRKETWEYDVVCGVLVRASTVQEARRIAADNHGDEGLATWFQPSTQCIEATAEGEAGILLTDFRNG